MKESYWGVMIIALGVIALMTVYFFQSTTSIDEQNYNLLKDTTEAAMYDAIDLAVYTTTGVVKINREKFVENFIRRFAANAKLATKYTIEFYDINESPPKVSVRVRSVEGFNATGDILEFNIDNRLDAILETPY